MRSKFEMKMLASSVLGLAIALAAAPLAAQTPSTQPPYNIDLGQGTAALGVAGTAPPLVSMVGQAAGTVNSVAQNNLDKSGADCTISGLVSTGGPSVTFAIQGFDAIANAWQTRVVSGSLTAAANATISVHPGNQTSSLPTGISAAQSFPLPRAWRVQVVVTGGTGLTAKVGCNLLK